MKSLTWFWDSARSILVVVVMAFRADQDVQADELLWLSGASPRIQFVDTVDGQQWILYADRFGVDLQDLTNGRTPFRVRPGAVADTLVLGLDRCLGVGVGTPAAGLHVNRPSIGLSAEVVARFEVADDLIGRLTISNATTTDGVFIPKIAGRAAAQNAALIHEAIISVDLGNNPAIAYNAVKGAGGGLTTRPLVVYRNNNVAMATIAANGDITATSFNPASSRAIKHDIVELDSRMAGAALRQLTPVEFVYNSDESREKRVGFIAEDVPDLVANADRQSVPIMDVVALLTKVVQDQQRTIDRLNDRVTRQNEELAGQQDQFSRQQDQLLRRLEAVERMIR